MYHDYFLIKQPSRDLRYYNISAMSKQSWEYVENLHLDDVLSGLRLSYVVLYTFVLQRTNGV